MSQRVNESRGDYNARRRADAAARPGYRPRPTISDTREARLARGRKHDRARQYKPARVAQQKRIARKLFTGWTHDEWQTALEAQGGICAKPGCDKPVGAADHIEYLDPCLKFPRAALCIGHNVALHHYDNPDPELVEYVRSWRLAILGPELIPAPEDMVFLV